MTDTLNKAKPQHTTAFAGINGAVVSLYEHPAPVAPPSHAVLPSHAAPQRGGMLLDTSGLWAVRLNTLSTAQGRTLLQVLRDLTPPGTQTDTPFIQRISAYDEAATKDTVLASEIEEGVRMLDTLSRRVTGSTYLGLGERSLRRTVLHQMEGNPFFARLGIHMPTHSKAAAL